MDDRTKLQVLQLAGEGLSQRAIAERLGLSRGAVWRALRPHSPTAAGGSTRASRAVDTAPIEQDSAVPLAVGFLVLAALAIYSLRKPQDAGSATRPQVKPPGAGKRTRGGWVMLESGQVVWRGERPSLGR